MVRLYSGGTDLDLGEFSTTLTFSIADIREPDKRNASFSKTLTLPGTKANNKFFENMFEVDVVTQTYNPNLKVKTILSVDGVTQFKGALKLVKVNYLIGGKVEYECNLIGNLSDLIQTLGNLRLRDLDLSAYDHTLTQANIVTSWTPTLGTGYVYPMINYGEVTSLGAWDVGYFRPAPFVKTVWDKIFSTAGFSYSSTFLTSDLFKRLIVPNSNDHLRLTGTQVNSRLFQAGRSTAQTINNTPPTPNNIFTPIVTTLALNNDSTGIYFDNGGDFDTTNFWHAPTTYVGTETYALTFDFSMTNTKSAGSVGANGFTCNMLAEVIAESNGVIIGSNSFNIVLGGTLGAGAGTNVLSGSVECALENVVVGSPIHVYVKLFTISTSDAAIYTTDITWSLSNIIFRNSVVNNVMNIGDTLILASSLPDMLQKDFVMGIVKLFNLYLEQDKDDETLLNIEPRDTYYNTTQVDWSAKLATERNLEINPMALLNFKRVTCSYKKDSDYYNKLYDQEYIRNYGSYLADINNEYVQGDYKIETNFAPTPLVGSFENDRIIPTIFQSNSGTPPTIEPFGAIPRILYWGGLINCQTWHFTSGSITGLFKTQYPYAGHLDNPQAPTIDLSFGVPQKVYYGVNQFISSLTYTDNNLYNKYYSAMISEITDRDSKLVTGYFWLTTTDILNLDFKKIYRIGSHALRLNKIYDYNPVTSNLTKCEFIKIKDTATFTSASATMNGGLNTTINSRENAPVIDMGTFQGGNVVSRPSTTVITGEKNFAGGGLSTWVGGRNNRVHGRNSSGVVITGEDNIVQDGASGVVIHGYANNVGFGARNLFIQGSRNTIAPNLSNVTLLNTDGAVVTESSITYLNNARIIKGNTAAPTYSARLSITTAQVLLLNTTPLTIVAAPGSGYAIELISASRKLTYNTVTYATNTNLQLIVDTANDYVCQWGSGGLNSTVSNIFQAIINSSITAAETQLIENKSLNVQVATGDPTAGNSGIVVYVTYRIITL